jgi:hypothetical protein
VLRGSKARVDPGQPLHSRGEHVYFTGRDIAGRSNPSPAIELEDFTYRETFLCQSTAALS